MIKNGFEEFRGKVKKEENTMKKYFLIMMILLAALVFSQSLFAA
jgi:hypothetical protein